jgi:hypothetical protein
MKIVQKMSKVNFIFTNFYCIIFWYGMVYTLILILKIGAVKIYSQIFMEKLYSNWNNIRYIYNVRTKFFCQL